MSFLQSRVTGHEQGAFDDMNILLYLLIGLAAGIFGGVLGLGGVIAERAGDFLEAPGDRREEMPHLESGR